jgi:hypothetical protein
MVAQKSTPPQLATSVLILDQSDTGFVCEIGYRVWLTVPPDEAGQSDAPPLFFESKFELTFALNPDANLSKTEIQVYCSVAGSMFAWPYLREFVSTSCPRMGVIPGPLPLVNLQQMIDVMAVHWKPVLDASTASEKPDPC